MPPRIKGDAFSRRDRGTILSEFRGTNHPEFRGTHNPLGRGCGGTMPPKLRGTYPPTSQPKEMIRAQILKN